MIQLLTAFALSLSISIPALAVGYECPEMEPGCTQSHVSTTGMNSFAPGCVAQYANFSCAGRPFAVEVNECLSDAEISIYVPLDEAGKSVNPGKCAVETQLVRRNCDLLCRGQFNRPGRCVTRRVACFEKWVSSSYCRCGSLSGDLNEAFDLP